MYSLVAPRARSLFGLAAATFLALAVGALAPACGSGDPAATTSTGGITSCDPGENIFCRCPGGEGGTKTCLDDGKTFDACVTRTGACPDPSSTTDASSSSGGVGGAGGAASTSVSGTGGSGGSGATLALYAPCAKDDQCDSGKCPMGYCSKDCAKFDECTLGMGECVQFQATQICMPVCGTTTLCDGAYGAPSTCGYIKAVDGTPVTTCADWKENLKLPPDGANCMDDTACNLGNEGVQAVCAFEACTKGCYAQTDCPANTTCSSTTALGACK